MPHDSTAASAAAGYCREIPLPETLPGNQFLPKTRRILERPVMEFRPFGKDEDGHVIRDMAGVSIRSNVEYLEECVAHARGPVAGTRAVEDLVRLLNERIPDWAYHVTAERLRNPWASYSNEFTAYLVELCIDLSGDPDFQFNMGKEKLIPPLIQTLMRPFSVGQIYKMAARWGSHYCKDSYRLDGLEVGDGFALLRMTLTEHTLKQFGPYRRACGRIWCNALKVGISIVPEKVHHLGLAKMVDRRCVVEGDEHCEWEVRWEEPARQRFGKRVITLLAKSALQNEIKERDKVIQEQMTSLETRHEELQKAYIEMQQTAVELQRRVEQLTMLHEAGLLFAGTVDREALLQNVLQTLIHKLRYDRAMITFFDPVKQVSYDARILGAPDDVAAYARSQSVPVTDPTTLEGMVLLHGKPLLVNDLREFWDRLHPRNQQLAALTEAKSIIAVPLKVKGRILGSLTVDRTREHSLGQDDLDLMVTTANQVAIALDNAEAYRQIEALNIGLEAKVRERTAELERLNEALKKANEQLHELDRLKSEFFANISHEFRTPLTLTLGTLRTLLKSSPTTRDRELIEAGLRNTSRLLFLINEFLDLAKLDSGSMELHKQCLDLAALVRAVAANFESAERRRVHFQGVGAPVPIEADLGQMKKILYNLLSNAFKFSDPDKGGVWIRLASKGDQVALEVEDNGIGIPRDQLGRIFERFVQVERRATRRHEGTGIGLALVREIVTLHGGTITVESEPGRGSTFIITLPRGAATADAIVKVEDDESVVLPVASGHTSERMADVAEALEAGSRRPLVLVVDDNADMRGYLARLLSNHYRIILARDGVEGMQQAAAFHPDLILTDLMMPRMSGDDLLKAVRGDDELCTTPVVFLTARTGSEVQVKSLEAGADDYIAKPFDENEILARVGKLIRLRAQERKLATLQKEKMARFLPTQLADIIFSNRAEDVLKSHRAEITVVFIDLRGFTAFAETGEPEDVITVLHEYQAAMGRLIAEYHGLIERFSGDAIMIFFNDPVPVPDHAEQAVRLALAMRDGVVKLKHKWGQRGIDLGAGIGVATGYATLGLVGFEQRKDYAAIGAVTNLAARLCGEARHGQILISERVRHFVKDLVHAESVGAVALKGFQKPVQAYNVAGLASGHPPASAWKSKPQKKR
jgi:signal transduction histidine kinase/class 3 adenylate cyclase